MDKPDIVVGTPSSILVHLKEESLVLNESLQMLVIDEADLVMAFGHEDDLNQILK